jgi:dihydrofolate synthase/folylpolyglutamate synthase
MTSRALLALLDTTLGPRDEKRLSRDRALRLYRMRALLAELGHPERRFFAIQVLGTSGKGSTAATLSAILTAAHIPSGLSTKPYLVSPIEHFRIQDIDVPIARLRATLKSMRPAVRKVERRLGEQLTLFEILTGLGATLFAQARVRVGIFEAGLGGRTDATTALLAPVKIITSIGIDHPVSLGRTLEAIARHKAGAIRRGDTVVTSASGTGLRVVRALAGKRQAILRPSTTLLNPRMQSSPAGTTFFFRQRRFHTRLIGPHQAQNTGAVLLAVEALRERGLRISDSAIREGLRRVRWPGRFEILETRPRIILDGAHNPSKIRAVANTLDALNIPRSNVLCIFACKTTKDAPTMLRILAPHCRTIVYPRLESVEGLVEPETLVKLQPGQPVASLKRALQLTRSLARLSDTILLTGSLTLVGEHKRLLL